MKKENIFAYVFIFVSLFIMLALQSKNVVNLKKQLKIKQDSLTLVKRQLKDCDYAYKQNYKQLDSLAKEHYKNYDVAYRTQENVKALKRFVRENGR